jgi:peroxiredoxin
MRLLPFLALLFLVQPLSAQLAPNFNVSDVDGVTHRLYEDYLDQDYVVVLKIFFVNCPPCNAVAPTYQSHYQTWGEGTNGVQFFELTNKVTDSNAAVTNYKNQHGLTMPSVSADGGAVAAQAMYTNGTFGPFYGTPHFMVIAPDKSVVNGVSLSNLDQVIMNNLPTTGAPVTPVKLLGNNSSIPSGISVFMKPMNVPAPIINLTDITNGTYEFNYPSQEVPMMADPVIFISSDAPAQDGSIRAGDLIPVRKHILGLEPFTDPRDIIKADVNGDNRIRSSDLVEIRSVILGLKTEFPNAVPSYKLYPEEVDFDVSGTSLVTIDLEILKMGDIQQ